MVSPATSMVISFRLRCAISFQPVSVLQLAGLDRFFFFILIIDTKESSVTYYLWLKLGKEVMLHLLNVLSLREEVARGPGSMLETAEDTNRKKPTPEDVLKSQITSSLTPLTSHPIVTSDKKFPDFHLDFLYLLVKTGAVPL